MADTKKYYIQINGITESVDAVDSLLKKLNDLEERINALNQKGIKVEGSGGSSGGGSRSRVSDLTAEQKIIDQINRSQEKREALEGEIGKMLADEKQAMKELNAEQKSLAAMDRVEKSGILNGGDLPTTMLGLKSTLADIKAAMQTMDMNSEQFANATNKALEITNALKSAEEAYGTYSRNVGNYSNSIMEAMKEVTITIGDQEVKFKSLKQAQKELEQSITSMSKKQEEGTQKYKDTAKALQEVEHAIERGKSAVDDLKASSLGMDEALDWMQSFGAMGQITQGFSAFFGNTGFEESVQKLMSLQSMLQGLEQLRKQMNTGEGFGGMFKTMSQGADEAAVKLLRVKGGMEGLATASRTTTVAVKGLSVVIKGLAGLGIGLLIEGAMKLAETIGGLIGKLFGWSKENEALVSSSDVASAAIERQKNHFAELEDQAKKDFLLGKITEQEYLAQKTELATRAILEEIEAYRTLVALGDEDKMSDERKENLKYGLQEGKDYGYAEGFVPAPPIVINSWDELLDKLEEYEKKVSEGVDQTQEFYGAWTAILPDFNDGVKDTKKVFETLVDVTLGEFMNKYEEAMKKMASGTKENVAEATEEIKKLYDLIKDDGILNSYFLNLEKYIDDHAIIAKLRNIKSEIKSFMSGITFTGDDLEKLKLDALPSKERRRALIEKEYEADKKKFADNAEAMKLVEQKHQNQLNELAEKGGAKRVSTAKHTSKQTLDVEKEKSRLEIELMSEGLKKRIAQLNKQRDEELKKVKGHKELELRVNQLYDKKILEERKKFAKDIEKTYKELYANILDMTINNLQSQVDYMDNELDNELKKLYDKRSIQTFSEPLKIIPENIYTNLTKQQEEYLKKLRDLLKEDMELAKQVSKLANNGIDTTEIENRWKKVTSELTKMKDGFKNIFKKGDFSEVRELIQNFDVTFAESTEQLKLYLDRTDGFWLTYIKKIKDNIKEEYKTREELIKKSQEKEENDNKAWRQEQIDKLNEYYGQLSTDDKRSLKDRANDNLKYTKAIKDIIEQARIQETEIKKKYDKQLEELNQEHNSKINEQTKEANNQRLNDTIAALQTYSQIVSKNVEKQPVRDQLGFIEVAHTNKILRESLKGLELLQNKIIETRKLLRQMWDAGEISTDEYNDKLSDLRNLMEGLDEQIRDVKEGLSWEGKIQDFFQNLQQYYSAISDSFQTILSEFQNNQDYMIERQMDALDKENEELQKKLEENEKILERHKNNVDKIEGELADARGDRRERLIDALNQEIIAQRRAQAEKEKLEKEQEKIEERQRELEKKQKEYEYQRGLQQILFQTSQAIMSAAVNSWPIPAVPLMALAAATGAMQYSLAKQRKPYAEGGILDGLSHENGGISVGNSNIEVEGGEYVVNKRSTANNTELLNLINNSDRQLTPSDLMNFATNMSVSPLEVNMPESSSLETAFVAYAQRPIVVDVREITSRQESVRNVQVLSGIR